MHFWLPEQQINCVWKPFTLNQIAFQSYADRLTVLGKTRRELTVRVIKGVQI